MRKGADAACCCDDEHTSQQIWLYTLLLVPATLLLVYPMHVSGAVYVLALP